MGELQEIALEFSRALEIAQFEIVAGILAIIIFLILFIITFMGYFKTLLHIASFAYVNARVRAMGNPFIQQHHVSHLLDAKNVHEFFDRLQVYGYSLNPHEMMDTDAFERNLNFIIADEGLNLEMASPEGLKPFIRAYMMIFEAEQLKAAIRGKNAGISPEEFERDIIPVGILEQGILHRMAQTRDMGELVSLLQDTPYGAPLGEALPAYIENNSTTPLEYAIDHAVSAILHSSLLLVDPLISAPVTHFVNTYADITNIKILLRARKDGLPKEQVQSYLIAPGARLSVSRLQRLAEAGDLSQIITQLMDTPYWLGIEGAIPAFEEMGSLNPIEHALDKHLLDAAGALETVYHHGPGPIIKFLFSRQIEARNIRTIFWGIHDNLQIQRIRNVLVLEEGAS